MLLSALDWQSDDAARVAVKCTKVWVSPSHKILGFDKLTIFMLTLLHCYEVDKVMVKDNVGSWIKMVKNGKFIKLVFLNNLVVFLFLSTFVTYYMIK